MLYVIPIIAIVFCILSYLNNQSLSNPYFAFNLLWSIVGCFLAIGNENVYKPSNLACTIVIVGIVAFNLSRWCPLVKISKKKTTNVSWMIDDDRMMFLTLLLVLLTLFSTAASIRDIMNGVPFTQIRDNYYDYDGTNGTFLYYLRNYLITPITYALISCTFISVFSGNRVHKVQLLTMLTIIIVQALTSGGRYILMNSFFAFACGYSLYSKHKQLSFTRKISIIVIISILLSGIIYLTNERSTYSMRNMSIVQKVSLTIYDYFAGSVTYMDKVIDTFPAIVGSTYGLNFIAGFITPFFALLSFLHILSWPKLLNVIGVYACSVLRIGPESYYNAMPTIFGYFYIDGGFVLLFIESFLFGYICKKVYDNATNGNLLFVGIFILIFIQICISSTRWAFYSPDFCLAVLYLKLIIKRKNSLVL